MTQKPLSDKIHKEFIPEEGLARYLCNQTCNTFPEKRTNIWENVTCKNCLYRKAKEEQ